MTTGRNEPCPCGSGLKYKRCHGAPWTAAASVEHPERDADAMAERRATAAKAHDKELDLRLLRFGRSTFGAEWLNTALEVYADGGGPAVGEAEIQLAVPWALHAYAVGDDGRSLSSLYRDRKGRYLSPELRDLLDAQLESWCSLWVVEKVQHGTSATLRDLLSEERRLVHERMGTADLEPDLVLLGRVVDVNGISFLAGMHPRPVWSDRTFELVRQARSHFRVRTRAIKPERLRDSGFQLWLIGAWRALVEAMDRPPALTNTDGDSLVPTVDHFTFGLAWREELIHQLAAIPGAEVVAASREDGDESDVAERTSAEGATEIVVAREGNRQNRAMENTIIGVLRVGAGTLEAETNSTRRADALRKGVEKAAGALVQHRLREETSVERMLDEFAAREVRGERPPPRPPQPPEALEALREFKRRHYAAWLDESIPALGGLTPRAAARSPTMREQLENLLRRLEQGEAALPEGERGDVVAIRRELGM